MTRLAWMCVAFGLVAAEAMIAVLIYDPYAVASGKTTVCRFTLDTAERCPWFVVLVVAVLALPLGILLGHLFAPADGRGRPALAMMAAVCALVAGVVIGHRWFAQ